MTALSREHFAALSPTDKIRAIRDAESLDDAFVLLEGATRRELDEITAAAGRPLMTGSERTMADRRQAVAIFLRPMHRQAAKKAAPAPPAPERMSLAAVKTELQRGGVTVPPMVPRSTLSDELGSLRRSGDTRQVQARLRQADIDQRRAVAESVAEVAELLGDGVEPSVIAFRAQARLKRLPEGSPARVIIEPLARGGTPAQLRRAMATAERKAGLKAVGGDTMDSATMRPVGGSIRPGSRVVVVRPGYTVEIDGQRVVLSKAVVREQRGADIGLPSRDAPTLREIMDSAPSDAEFRRITDPMSRDEFDAWMAGQGRPVREGIEGTYAGLQVEVFSATVQRGRIQIQGTIRDAQGREVGEFVRLLTEENGRLVAVHNTLVLDRRVQGSGFAEAFNQNLLDWYRRSGVAEVRLTANIDVGGYAWARKGYDFEDAAAARMWLNDAKAQIEETRETLRRRGRLPKGIIEADLDALDAYVDDMLAGRTPARVAEIAEFGRQPGQGGRTAIWPGKWILLGSSWRGKMVL